MNLNISQQFSKRKKLIFSITILTFSISVLSSPTENEEKPWLLEGEILLEMKRFSEAESLANSILESTPSDLKAEFLLTRAWIGLGSQERKKGNLLLARNYLEKAYEKWPLNETLQSELAELKNQKIRKTMQASLNSKINNDSQELKESLKSLEQEINLLRNELENERNSSSSKRLIVTIQILLGIQILLQGFHLFKSRKH
ncbi:hypothetical protein EHQ81_12035 [Leptospira selangorensis]|uniref:Tetratricopeptide repeat protein n=1 Tax=Leptospira selangorensis TaxID=2484982 RepID=A0A5F2C286_9LEPT|nr:tetratricopeptide repeat protein [Leptospira selangorensis]TGM12977.1 hypothetical protein EHQ81_12035 [Leptospira selangorensis]TGM21272.1 hypothetical protein EHQ82_09715 [Leptospira selangorensis]